MVGAKNLDNAGQVRGALSECERVTCAVKISRDVGSLRKWEVLGSIGKYWEILNTGKYWEVSRSIGKYREVGSGKREVGSGFTGIHWNSLCVHRKSAARCWASSVSVVSLESSGSSQNSAVTERTFKGSTENNEPLMKF